MLCKLGLEVCFEAFRVRLRKRDWGSNIEVVKKVGDMQKHRVAGLTLRRRLVGLKARMTSSPHFSDPEQLDGRFPSMQGPLFRLNLLEAKTICVLIKVVQRGPVPLLVFLRILLL